MVPVRLSGPGGESRVRMLVDSGADCAIVGPALADVLGLEEAAAGFGRGLSARVPVGRSHMYVEVIHPSAVLPLIEVPVEILHGRAPPFPVLGREGWFQAYDILFRVGPLPERGMFYLSPHNDSGRRRSSRRSAVRSEHRGRAMAA